MTANQAAAGARPVRFRWRFLSLAAIWLLLAYLALVLPIDRLLPALNTWVGGVALIVISLALTVAAAERWLWQGSGADDRTKNTLMLAATVLICLLTGDAAFTLFTNLRPGHGFDLNRLMTGREQDAQVWTGEAMPTAYFPTAANFLLYKPGQTRISTVYGEHYYPALLHHKVIRDEVLEARKTTVVIDNYGLRNTDDPAAAKVFALGDSFCFGYDTTQEAVFTERMKSLLGMPVYNMGVAGTSPFQQFLLFEYMLRTYPDAFKPRQLLWLVFEGNDLEETYDLQAPRPVSNLRRALDATIVGMVANLPALVRKGSMIRLVTGGNAEMAGTAARQTRLNHYALDRDMLAEPLYRSPQFGPRIFRQVYLDRATQPQSYVRNHPNTPRLAGVFNSMQALAQERGFTVTIVTVPTDARLYKDQFEDFPPITKQPHFIDYVKRLSDENGFKRVDLNELLAPYAEKEMIYYRDDTHWNERGHEIVARILAEHAVAGR